MEIDSGIQKNGDKNIYSKKTKYIVTGLENEKKLEIDNEEIKKVNKLKYVGSILESDREVIVTLRK